MSQMIDNEKPVENTDSDASKSDLEETFATTHDTNGLFKYLFAKNNTVGPKDEVIGIGARWGQWTKTFRTPIIVFWLALVIPTGLYCFPKFVDATVSEFSAADGSLSEEAQDQYNELFDLEDEHVGNIIVLTQLEPGKGALPANETLCSTMDKTVNDFVAGYSKYLMDSANEYNVEGENESFAKIGSYYGYSDLDLNLLAEGYMSDDCSVTFLSVTFQIPDEETNVDDYVDAMVDYGNDYVPSEYVTIGFTGTLLYRVDIKDASGEDLERMDTIVVPLAMLILAFVLGNLPIMIIPLINIVTMVMFSGILMYPIALCMDVHTFTPSIMMSLSIAMSIDYSLFLISRCAEDVGLGHSKHHAIVNMLEYAGHTILASGSTLCVCFLGLLLFPVSMLQSVGIGASVAIIAALAVNLSLTPAILHTTRLGDRLLHPNKYFAALCCNEPGNAGRVTFKPKNTGNDEFGETPYGLLQPDGNEGEETLEDQLIGGADDFIDTDAMKASVWYKMGKFLLDRKKGGIIFIVILAFLIPVIIYFPETKNSISFQLIMPDSSPSLEVFEDLSETFGYGVMSPFNLVFDGTKSNNTIETGEAFELMQKTISKLVELKQTPSLESFSGIAVFGGENIPFDTYQEAMECGSSESCQNEFYRSLSYVADNNFNSPGDYVLGTKIVVALNVDPYTPEGTDWIDDARDVLDTISSGKYDIYLQGSSSLIYDVVVDVYNHFPLMICVTMLSVFILMGLFFRSVVAPIRSVITICLTEGFIYGFAVLVYQYGFLDWLGLSCFASTENSDIAWLSPVMSFSVIVGLGLDYDVFLISRILEYREKGYNDESSVLIGLYKTGGIITAAGVIMTVAFGGLLLSHTTALNQWAFYLAGAVLLDTFLIRTVLVPILMGYTGRHSWWPRNLVEPTRDVSQL